MAPLRRPDGRPAGCRHAAHDQTEYRPVETRCCRNSFSRCSGFSVSRSPVARLRPARRCHLCRSRSRSRARPFLPLALVPHRTCELWAKGVLPTVRGGPRRGVPKPLTNSRGPHGSRRRGAGQDLAVAPAPARTRARRCRQGSAEPRSRATRRSGAATRASAPRPLPAPQRPSSGTGSSVISVRQSSPSSFSTARPARHRIIPAASSASSQRRTLA